MKEIIYKSIGIVHSPLENKKEAPRQTIYGKDIEATVEIYSEFLDGLKGIEKHSRIILICHFDRSDFKSLKVIPPHSDRERGIFATRSPNHPNPIGLSIVQLEKVKDNILHIKGVDILNETPVLDIKPYIEELDSF